MDDNRFDEIIRDKVSGFEPVGFDPSALAGLHQNMASSFTLPWHVLYRSEIISAASVVILATVIIWSQWFFSNQTTNEFQSEIATLNSQNSSIDELREEFKILNNTKPDTIRIYQINETSAGTTYLIEEIDALKSALARFQDRRSDSDMIFLGNSSQLPDKLIDLLERQGFILEKGDEMYLIASLESAPDVNRKELDLGPTWDTELLPYPFISGNSETSENVTRSISAADQRKLNRHYWKGIGLEIGPALQAGKGSYDQGSGKPYIGFGILADVILSPSLSLETGAIYSAKSQELGSSDLQNLELPSVDTDLGPLRRAELDANTVEMPIALKYKTPLGKKNLTVSLGYSSFLYLNEEFEYTHLNPQISSDVVEIRNFDKISLHSGTVNANIGLQHFSTKGDKFETGIFYQKGVSKLGVEQLGSDFFGVRAVYWVRKK